MGVERKFSDDDVRKIYRDYQRGYELYKQIVPITRIAEKWGVTPQHCRRFYAGVQVVVIHAKLDEGQRQELWNELHEHYELEKQYKPLSCAAIARRHKVREHTIQRIVGGTTYKDIPREKVRLTKDQAIELAMKLIPEGRCTDNVLAKHGVRKSGVIEIIRRAEARYVNEAMRYFPPPTRYEESA